MKTKRFKINNQIITVSVPTDPTDSNIVHISKFRKNENSSYEFISRANAEGFFEEIGFMVETMENKLLDNQTLWDAFYTICEEHISTNGRLIDMDLEAFLDKIMILAEAITNSTGVTPISKKDGQQLREDFQNSAYKVFYDYIYINYFDSTDLTPFSKPQLIKFSDYNK